MKPLSIIILVTFFFIYWIRGNIFLDPDFGWHLRMGQLILEKGIPKTDPFSYTMPSYPFIDHEWLINIVTAVLYPKLRLGGLSFIFALLTILALFLALPRKINYLSLLHLALTAGIVLSFIGPRPQVLTLLFFVITLKIIIDPKLWTKFKFFLPGLFLIWANIHAGFIIGLFILLLKFLFPERNKTAKISIILALSLAATLINPYGFFLWQEIANVLTNLTFRHGIYEWRPFYNFENYLVFFLIPASGAFFILNWQKYNILEKAIYMLLLVLSIVAARNMPLFALTSLFLTGKSFEKIYPYLFKSSYILKALFFLTSLAVITQVFGSFINEWEFSKDEFYPKKAVFFLNENLPQDNIFSTYNWGGFLIWQLSQKRVFIDGRMPSWRLRKSNSKESNNALLEYDKLMSFEIPFSQAIRKYNIDTFLIPVEWLEQKKNRQEFLKEMGKNNMAKIYQDEISVIFSTYETGASGGVLRQ